MFALAPKLLPCLAALLVLQNCAAAPAWATKAVAASATKTKQPAPEVTLNFPTEDSFGKLELRASSLNAQGVKVAKISQTKAIGTVTVPKDCAIVLQLSYYGVEHINYIDQFDPAQLVEVNAGRLELDDNQMKHLQKFKNLYRLNLDNTLVSDKSMPILGSLKKLIDLRISATDITGSAFDQLDGLPLTNLNMDGINLKAGSLSKIKSLPKMLTSINCSKTNLSGVDLAFICQCPLLNNLVLTGNKTLNDSNVQCLANLKNLNTLNITDTAITDKSLPMLIKLPSLRKLTLRKATFFKHSQHPPIPPTLHITDAGNQGSVPVEVFEPLH